ncbi:MAG TPA: response regulator [Vicinamibacterales bacterium]|jgi:twitching motility two-component system response regulator PilH
MTDDSEGDPLEKPPAKKILVVEDHADLRRIFATALFVAGFDVQQAADGWMALNLLETDPPDLVVLDLFLPNVSGFVVQQELAARVDLQHIPVVVVTAAGPEQTLGMKVPCILHKPVLPDELVAAVRQCLAAGAPPVT